MTEIMENIFVGNEQDYYSIQHQPNWGTLHCCKNPFHCSFVGYRGSLSPTHPNYALKQKDNEMALNLVDMDKFSPDYLQFNKDMFTQAFAFLDHYMAKSYNLLIHCNQGESRGPTLGMLYAARLGKFQYMDFEKTLQQFKHIYPYYSPKANIYLTTKSLWNDFVIMPK